MRFVGIDREEALRSLTITRGSIRRVDCHESPVIASVIVNHVTQTKVYSPQARFFCRLQDTAYRTAWKEALAKRRTRERFSRVRRKVKNVVQEHAAVLTRKHDELISVDDYGIEDRSRWNEELKYFLERVVAPKVKGLQRADFDLKSLKEVVAGVILEQRTNPG